MVADPSFWSITGASTAFSTLIVGGITLALKSKLDADLAKLGSRLRDAEERSRSLVSAVQRGEQARAEILQRRRIESLEAIWVSAIAYSQFERAEKILEHLNIENIMANDDPESIEKIKLFAGDLVKLVPSLEGGVSSDVGCSQIYVSPVVWSFYQSYVHLMSFSRACLVSMRSGPTMLNLLAWDEVANMILVALPDMKKFMEEHGKGAVFGFSAILKDALRDAIKREFSSVAWPEQDLERAKRLLDAADRLQQAETSKAPDLS